MTDKATYWAFTDWNLLDWEQIFIKSQGKIGYILVGNETSKDNKKHKQGWLQMKNQSRRSALKKLIQDNEIHLEPCRSNIAANEAYCKKEGDYQTFGKLRTAGHRSDMEDACNMIRDGETMEAVADKHPGTFLRYHTGLYKYQLMKQKRRTRGWRQVEVGVYYGRSRTGKTTAAMKAGDPEDTYLKQAGDGLQWWDSYDGEKTIVIDDYSNSCSAVRLMNLLDNWPCMLQIKGGHVFAEWNKVIITTNLTKEEFHEQAREAHQEALMNRIHTWKHFAVLQKGDQYLSQQRP